MEEKFNEKLQKNIKKCVIKEEGKEYPHQRVTVWTELPIYDAVRDGYDVPEGYYVEVVDSKDKNPRGGFYKNRTLKEGNPQAEQSGDKLTYLTSLVKDIHRAVVEQKEPSKMDEINGDEYAGPTKEENDPPF